MVLNRAEGRPRRALDRRVGSLVLAEGLWMWTHHRVWSLLTTEWIPAQCHVLHHGSDAACDRVPLESMDRRIWRISSDMWVKMPWEMCIGEKDSLDTGTFNRGFCTVLKTFLFIETACSPDDFSINSPFSPVNSVHFL